MAERDELDELRQQLADVEAVLEDEPTDELKARAVELERRIAELQNPVGPAVDVEAEEVTAEEAEDFKPSGGELVVRDPSDDTAVLRTLDRHDEQQIIEEFQRRALRVMLYDFEHSGSRLVDLSYQGVNEAIRLLNATGKCEIAIDQTAFNGRGYDEQIALEDVGNGPEEFYVVTVYAVDKRTGYGQFGTSSEPKLMRLRNGKTRWDVFARTKALNKAQRNALKTMIPEQLRQTLIAQYKGDAVALKQIQAGAGAAALAELPPPLTDERAEELRGRAREVYGELREVSSLTVLPAQFHAYLTRAEHSHERLEEFVAYLVDKLEQAKAAA